MIGVLLNTWTYNHIIYGIETFENIQFYQMFSQIHEVPLCLYCIQGVSSGQPYLEGLVLDPALNTLSKQRIPWPKDHFCRAVLSKRNTRIMEICSKKHNLRFYQLESTAARDKLKHIAFLRHNINLHHHLPDTAPLTASSLLELLEKHRKVIIKPVTGWLGKNIVLIEQKGKSFFINSIELSLAGQKAISTGELMQFFDKRYRLPRGYMVQQKIEAHTFHGRVSECRVSVQKSQRDKWEVTGKAVRLAQPGREITNIRQGADAVPYQSLFPENRPALDIGNLSVAIARELEKHLQIIDLGLDLMFDQNQHLWFIEANLRDQRLTYKTANDYETWYRTTTTPLAYILEQAKQPASFITHIANGFRRLIPINR